MSFANPCSSGNLFPTKVWVKDDLEGFVEGNVLGDEPANTSADAEAFFVQLTNGKVCPLFTISRSTYVFF